jgi:hypothetical protein
VGLAQEEQRVQVDRREVPNREGFQDKKEHCIQAHHRQAPDLRSSITGSSTLTTTFPNTCTVTFGFKNICAKSKRIVVEVHTERAENEEFDLEQQKAGTTALTSPLYAKNTLRWRPTIGPMLRRLPGPPLLPTLSTSRSKTPDKFKNQVAETGANYQPL